MRQIKKEQNERQLAILQDIRSLEGERDRLLRSLRFRSESKREKYFTRFETHAQERDHKAITECENKIKEKWIQWREARSKDIV
jgi:hypothetical protein